MDSKIQAYRCFNIRPGGVVSHGIVSSVREFCHLLIKHVVVVIVVIVVVDVAAAAVRGHAIIDHLL